MRWTNLGTVAFVCGVLAIAAARQVSAAGSAGCCACLIEDHDSVEPAFFCVSPASPSEMTAAEDRCHAIPGASLLCVASTVDETAAVNGACVQELLGLGVKCPATSGAPALGHTGVAALAGLLGLLGAWSLGRRAIRRS